MELALIILGIVLLIAGLIGCFVPVLPGPPLSYVALLLLQLKADPPFSIRFLVIMGAITVAVTVLDYLIPVFGAKKWGGSRLGIFGTIVGVIVGLFYGPVGIILFPIIGAFVGELLNGKTTHKALKSAFGTFMGFLFGTLIKFSLALVISYYFIIHL